MSLSVVKKIETEVKNTGGKVTAIGRYYAIARYSTSELRDTSILQLQKKLRDLKVKKNGFSYVVIEWS